MEKQETGLIANGRGVPLEGVRIEALLSGPCVEVTLTQRYRNVESVPVEAVYVFPMEEGAAVCGFAARIGDRIVRGKVEEREKAFATYDDAMMDGHGAFLLDQERPNVFTASVGNLRPKEVVELQIKYVAFTRREGAALRFSVPTTVSPRYVPQGKPEIGQPDGERVNPEHWPSVAYGFQLRVEVEATAALRRVESPSHPIRATLRDRGATVELAQDEAALDRDFVLLVETAEPEKPFAMVAREPDGRRTVMVSFLPDLKPDSALGQEVLFLLDCSGSMRGGSIEQAKRAVLLCMRALGETDSFDILRFGSRHDGLWKEARPFDERSLEEASGYVKGIDANLGGTEILSALRVLLERPRDPKRPRQILLLTDGQVSNDHEVIALAKEHSGHARIFTFGIGAGASEHLVRGVARASRGGAEMIFPGERIEPKVLRAFDRLRTPAFDDARIDWKGLNVEQAPRQMPPIFAGEALTVLARVDSGSVNEIDLVAGNRRWSVAIDLERPGGYRDAARENSMGPIPVLWARERIRELEEADQRGSSQQRPGREDRKRAELVELSVRYGLLSSAASFVAVEERDEKDKAVQKSELRRIPVALTIGWGGVGAATPARPAFRRMAVASAAMPSAPAPKPMATNRAGAYPQRPEGFLAKAKAILSDMAPPEPAQLAESKADHDSSDRLFDLLMTQKADGSFARSPELSAWLGDRDGKVADAIAKHGEAAVVTAVVIALLEMEAADRESEWRPAVTKAKRWLADNPVAFDAAAVLRS